VNQYAERLLCAATAYQTAVLQRGYMLQHHLQAAVCSWKMRTQHGLLAEMGPFPPSALLPHPAKASTAAFWQDSRTHSLKVPNPRRWSPLLQAARERATRTAAQRSHPSAVWRPACTPSCNPATSVVPREMELKAQASVWLKLNRSTRSTTTLSVMTLHWVTLDFHDFDLSWQTSHVTKMITGVQCNA
jgi:hypothetical protein